MTNDALRKMTGLITLVMLAVLAIPLMGLATENDKPDEPKEGTCKDLGYGDNLDSDSSDAWGSIDFSDTEDTLTLEVNEGYEVQLCVKAGSVKQGNGPEDKGWFDEGTYEVGHSSGKELSHYGFRFRDTTTTTVPEETTTIPEETTTVPEETTTVPEETTTVPEETTTVPEKTTTVPEEPTTVPEAPRGAPRTPATAETLSELPFTGDEMGRLALVAFAALALGGTFVLSARKRRQEG